MEGADGVMDAQIRSDDSEAMRMMVRPVNGDGKMEKIRKKLCSVCVIMVIVGLGEWRMANDADLERER